MQKELLLVCSFFSHGLNNGLIKKDEKESYVLIKFSILNRKAKEKEVWVFFLFFVTVFAEIT